MNIVLSSTTFSACTVGHKGRRTLWNSRSFSHVNICQRTHIVQGQGTKFSLLSTYSSADRVQRQSRSENRPPSCLVERRGYAGMSTKDIYGHSCMRLVYRYPSPYYLPSTSRNIKLMAARKSATRGLFATHSSFPNATMSRATWTV